MSSFYIVFIPRNQVFYTRSGIGFDVFEQGQNSIPDLPLQNHEGNIINLPPCPQSPSAHLLLTRCLLAQGLAISDRNMGAWK
jgi:hypothetical protein